MDGRMLKALWGLWLLAALLPAQAQEVYYIHTDALGSPVAETDANRNVVARFEYEPYGRRLNGGNDDKPGYTGHVMDAVTGLVQMQQRYYDPGIGRFWSVDPVAADPVNGTNFNRYKYAANNPYRFADPDGREEIDCRKKDCGTIKIKDLKPGDVVYSEGANLSVAKNGDVEISYKEGLGDGASAARKGPIFVPRAPSGASVDANIAEASEMTRLQFYRAVRNGGRWDYKQDKSGDFAPFGNFNYGATGAEVGFSTRTLLEAAGVASMKANPDGHPKAWGIPLIGFRSRGDDPDDQYWIQQGIRYHSEKKE